VDNLAGGRCAMSEQRPVRILAVDGAARSADAGQELCDRPVCRFRSAFHPGLSDAGVLTREVQAPDGCAMAPRRRPTWPGW